MARIIFSNGVVIEISPKNGTDFQLDELQKFVGGYIEVVPLDRTGEIMVLNEEGKLIGLPPNMNATAYLAQNSRFADFIVGDVLVCDSGQVR